MHMNIVVNAILTVLTSVFVLAISANAFAACSESRIKELREDKKSVATIARTCKMTKADVEAALEEEEPDEPVERPRRDRKDTAKGGLPSGAALSQCACWGPDSGQTRPNTMCKSGYAAPQLCSMPCVGGGYAWRGVCT